MIWAAAVLWPIRSFRGAGIGSGDLIAFGLLSIVLTLAAIYGATQIASFLELFDTAFRAAALRAAR